MAAWYSEKSVFLEDPGVLGAGV